MLKMALQIIFVLSAALTLAIATRALFKKRSLGPILEDVFYGVLAMIFSLPEDMRFHRFAQATLLGIATVGAFLRFRHLRKRRLERR
jgi:hypothetical protein